MTAPHPVDVVIAVDAADAERFAEAVTALRAAGLTVSSEQPGLGTVTGTAAEDRLAALESVPGVVAVERERVHRLPPPDSPVQ
ncbi:hypothetical protein RM780_15705 [Streptomyces sp. DSM 44917]|uniref:Ketohydroxyglutarate aldolase n=1 Tax=Streptomyces boetiae TaxID=3075541 RepID=A0ABU2LA84_9ACTN|nr:hypothetical protein [Streptomyces sp. DSM 44917]MDT0308396.1 hypothetical protein [Streptomyces sp. DSM 44917]